MNEIDSLIAGLDAKQTHDLIAALAATLAASGRPQPAVPGDDPIAAAESLFSALAAPLGKVGADTAELGLLRSENAALRTEVEALRAQRMDASKMAAAQVVAAGIVQTEKVQPSKSQPEKPKTWTERAQAALASK